MTTQYVMRAFKTTVPTGHVYWAVLNAPDLTGAESGYNPADLTNIVVDYSFEVPINGSGGAVPPGLAGGDLTGTYPDPSVAKIAGTKVATTTPTDGQVLTYVAANQDWEPKPSVAGGGNAGGDLSGTYPNPTVAQIHSATVPAAGSLTPGNVLQVSGASALTYGPVNLAGGISAITGQLPTGNQVPQTVGGDLSGTTASATIAKLDGYVLSASNPQTGQYLGFNGSTWTPATISSSFPPSGVAGGDLAGSYPNPTVAKLQGRSVASITPQNGYVLTWNSTNIDWEPTRTFAFEVQANPSWFQTTWYIDPQGTFGGDDANDGYTISTPVKTWAQVILRLGTYSPLLTQNTTFTFLSNHVDNSDPVIFTPYLGGNGINVIITGVLNSSNQVSTGAFSGLIAKNRDTGTLLTTTLTNTPIPGWFIYDTTNDGYSWVYKNPSSNVAVLSQPLTSSVASFNTDADYLPGYSLPLSIDTSIDGNVYFAYEPIHVNVVQIAAQIATQQSFNTGRIIIQNIVIFDPNGAGNDDVIIGDYVALLECRLDKYSLIKQGYNDGNTLPIFNCFTSGSVIDSLSVVVGGVHGLLYGTTFTSNLGCYIDNDIIFPFNSNINSGFINVGNYYIEQGATFTANSNTEIQSFSISNTNLTGEEIDGYSIVWGPGNINVNSSYIYDNTDVNKAQGHFKNAGSLTINNKLNAYSFDPSRNGILRSGISITPVQLDTSLSSGGFGGTAFIPSGGTITSAGNDGYGYGYSTTDALSVTNWYIDPQAGNDSNDGKTTLTPIRTWSELINRWGTSSPIFNTPVTVTFLSDQLSFADPVYLNPRFGTNGSLTVLGTLQHQMDGNLSSVVSKNKSATGAYPSGLLQANLTTAADGYTGYLLVNNTRSGALCWIDSISSGAAVLTNPFVSNTPTFNTAPNQVDTFANGDSFSIYQPTKIYVSGFVPGIGVGNIVFAHVWFMDPVSVGTTQVSMPYSSSCFESRTDIFMIFDIVTTVGIGGNLINSWANGGVYITSNGSMVGGGSNAAVSNANTFINSFVDGDAIIHGNTGFNAICQIGSAYLDNSNVSVQDNVTFISGDLILDVDQGTNYQFGLYGQYTLGFSDAIGKLTYLNATADQWFLGTPTLNMDGVAFANAYDRSVSPGVLYPARQLIVSNLDLPISQGGFGGLAEGDSGSVIYNGSQSSTSPTVLFTVGGAGFQDGYTSVSLTTGTVTLTAAEYQFPTIIFTGSLSGNVTIVFPAISGGSWTIDATSVTLNTNTITLQANGNNWGTTVGTTNLYSIYYGGTGRLYGQTLTP
jgi:hypothetical protein